MATATLTAPKKTARRNKKSDGFFVAPNFIASQEVPGWYVLRFWEVVAGPFAEHEYAAIEMMTMQNAAS